MGSKLTNRIGLNSLANETDQIGFTDLNQNIGQRVAISNVLYHYFGQEGIVYGGCKTTLTTNEYPAFSALILDDSGIPFVFYAESSVAIDVSSMTKSTYKLYLKIVTSNDVASGTSVITPGLPGSFILIALNSDATAPANSMLLGSGNYDTTNKIITSYTYATGTFIPAASAQNVTSASKPLDLNNGSVEIGYTDNLTMTEDKLDTIQGISSSSSPEFVSLTLSSITNQVKFGGTYNTTLNVVEPNASLTYTLPDATENADIMLATDSPTTGSVVISNGNSSYSSLTPGTSGYALVSQGAGYKPTWRNLGTSSLPTGATGSLLYEDGSEWVTLGIGNVGQVLAVSSSSLPTWATVSNSFESIELSNTSNQIVLTGNEYHSTINFNLPTTGTINYTVPAVSTDSSFILSSGDQSITGKLTLSNISVSSLTSNRILSNSSGLVEACNLSTFVSGTSNQIIVTDDGSGGVLLTTPQSIATTSAPTFASLELSSLTLNRLLCSSSSHIAEADLTSYVSGTADEVNISSNGTGGVVLSLPQSISTTSQPQFARIGLGTVATINSMIELPSTTSGSGGIKFGELYLYQSSSIVLRTNNCFYADNFIYANFDQGMNNALGLGTKDFGSTSTAAIAFGSDTNLYRSAANVLKTDDSLVISGSLFLTQATPASSGAIGTAGEIAVDANYIYVCTATNTWKKISLGSF